MDSNATDNTGDGWGSASTSNTSEQDSNPFGGSPSTGTDEGGGWGTSNDNANNTWTPSTSDGDEQSRYDDMSSATSPNGSVAIKQEPYAAVGGAAVKSEGNEIKKDEMGSGMADNEDVGEAAVWFMERVCVTLKRNDSPAVIKEINSDKTAVVELDEGTVLTVRPGEVSMVQPQEHDMVLVTGGADVGVEGELVCIDGTDAILKESNENFKIVDFAHLAKIKPN